MNDPRPFWEQEEEKAKAYIQRLKALEEKAKAVESDKIKDIKEQQIQEIQSQILHSQSKVPKLNSVSGEGGEGQGTLTVPEETWWLILQQGEIWERNTDDFDLTMVIDGHWFFERRKK